MKFYSLATISIKANSVVGKVNRLILGQNLEAGNTHGIFSEKPGRSNDGQGFWDPATATFVPVFLHKAKELHMGALRYPGGCLAHNFDWKKTIGPVSERLDFLFGLDEFLALCREFGAEPIMVVSDYTGTAQDAADLVEYLNAPATDGKPWAQKRAANGHPEPYNVKWFELGNESYHGNHEVKPVVQVKEGNDYVLSFYLRTSAALTVTFRLIDIERKGIPNESKWNHAPESNGDWVHVEFEFTATTTPIGVEIAAGASKYEPTTLAIYDLTVKQAP